MNVLQKYFTDLLSENRGSRLFLIYEVYRATALKMSTTSDTNITSSVTVGQVAKISSASGDFSLDHSSKSSLTISGKVPYVFAVRAAELVRTDQGVITLNPGKFKFPNDLGNSDEEKYTSPINGDYDSVTFSRMHRAATMSALRAVSKPE